MSQLSDETLARRALRDILADKAAPAAARAAAARTLLELAGVLGKGARPDQEQPSPFEMTRDQMNLELAGIEGRKP